MQYEFYRICKSREEAVGLFKAVLEQFKMGSSVPDNDHVETKIGRVGDFPWVTISMHASKAPGMFQLMFRSANRGHHERVRAALNRRKGRRIEWPPRAP